MVESSPDPEQNASRAELSQLLEEALLGLPEQYRTVVMLRDIEGMSTAETASALDLTEDNVKIRLHRDAPWHGDGLLSAWAQKPGAPSPSWVIGVIELSSMCLRVSQS